MVVATSSAIALIDAFSKDTLGRLRIRYVMPAAHLTLREEDVVRLTLEFLHSRDLHISQLSLERETGVINGQYSDDVLFLRQLILDGQWDDVLEFIQPLEALSDFDMRKFTYSILRHKYVELLCIKSEANVIAASTNNSVDNAVEEVVKVLSDLEKVAPSKEEYSSLCLLLTLPRLTDHLQYKDWNPSNARVQCFREVHPLVEKFLPGDRKGIDSAHPVTSAKNDRLIQLIIKGILYESCVNYCQAKATGSKESEQVEMSFSRLLDGSVGFSDSDLSLLSWLQSIPPETFAVPFAQRTLNVDVERLERPSLETSWTEHMLITPIKPKTFPHSAMPFTRPRSAADMMSRSLVPALEAGLGPRSPGPKNTTIPSAALMALSTGDINPMSRSSFASFHLTGFKNNKLMNTSVDRLFENEGDVFLSSNYAEFQQLPSIQETATNAQPKVPPRTRGHSKSPEGDVDPSVTSTPERRVAGRESPAPSTARSSRRDSLAEKPTGVAAKITEPTAIPVRAAAPGDHLEQSYNGGLFKEYQKQKQRLQETIQQKERERDELVRQLAAPLPTQADNRLQGEGIKQPLGSKGPSPVHTNTPVRSGIQSPKPTINGSDPVARQNSVPGGVYDSRLPEGHYDVIKPKMVRTYMRKASNGTWFQETMNEAVQKVKSGEMSLRGAADSYDIPYTTLQRRVAFAGSVIKHRGGQPVLDVVAEKKFADRLIYLANRGFYITSKNIRKYAFDFAVRHNLKHNFNIDAKMAGEDWFHRFMLRNHNVIIRKPEGLSKARINGMQEEKVKRFYEVLQQVIDDNNLQGKPECIYNQDEIGLPLSNRPPNIIARKGSKDVISMTSVERGENVAVLACMNAAGYFIPPFVIFKGVRKRHDFMIDTPPGTEIFMTEKGCITEEAFKAWLIHFNRYRMKGKVTLILNGHIPHINLAVVDLCEESDIQLVLLPPHTSHALQPLDVSFFKPLATYYHQQATSWQHSNIGKGITKIVFGGLLKHAWNLSASVGNASEGFEKTGIYPFNPHAISPHKFVSHVTPNDDINIFATEGSSTSSFRINRITDPQLSAGTDRHATIEDNAITTTIRDTRPTLEEQIPAKRTKVVKKPILHSTSPENRVYDLKRMRGKAEEEKKMKNKSNKDSSMKSIKKGKATPGLKIENESDLCKDWYCIYCAEKFIHPPVEDWIQCNKCEEWCHENCAHRKGKKGPFTCDLCVE